MSKDVTSTPADWALKRIFTTGEAAALCKVSQQTIIRCFDAGRLQGFRVPGSKFRRIPREELIRFMKANGIPVEVLEGGKKRVLLFLNDTRLIELFRDVFSENGLFEIRVAHTALRAGIEIARFNPHLIVFDYALSDLGPKDLLSLLKDDPHLKENAAPSQIRTLVTSVYVDPAAVADLKAAGLTEFIQQPFKLDLFMEAVYRVLEMKDPSREHQLSV